MGAPLRCSATKLTGYATRYEGDQTCSRWANRLVRGRPLCYQHAEIEQRPWNHNELEDRDMATIDQLAPPRPSPWWFLRLIERLTGAWIPPCEVCGHRATTRRGIVWPRSLARGSVRLCARRRCQRRIDAWQGSIQARRARALSDYELDHGFPTPHDLERGIPPQYPSVSRATLRAFLQSDLEAATVGGNASVTALNGSIRTLGFDREVYAEIRSGRPVLRRTVAA